MERAPTEEPQGVMYEPEVLPAREEADLLARLEAMDFNPIVMHGQEAKRTALHYGLKYDYAARTPLPGEPVPEWLEPVRAHAAALAGRGADELVQALVQRYPPGSTMGWHRDAPAFEEVIGISLRAPSRLRFQRGTAADRRVWEIVLEPRSGYVLAGEARRFWEHSIPAVKAERYSITFRTLRA